MAVSPADFEFYSRVTGIPIPNDPVARMRMAPQVYAMRRSPMSKVAGALGTAAKAALAGGAAVGAGLLVKELAGRMGESGETPKTEDVNISSDYSAPSAAEKGPEMSVSEPSTRDKAESFLNAFTGSVSTAPRDEPEVDPTGTPIKSALAAGFGSLEEARSNLQAKYGQRLSHQTEVPQADPNLANESFDAQRASVGEPVESLTTGMPAQAAPGVETAVAQAYEFFEGSPGKSPFQAGGAMNELGRQSRQVKQTVGDLPPQLASEVARFISNYRGNPVASEPEVSVDAPAQGFTQKEANSRIVSLMKEGIEQLEGGKPTINFPAGQGSKYESMTLDTSGDINVKFRKGGTTYTYPQSPEGSAAFAELADMYNNPAPAQRDPAFVTDKGIMVGDTLARAQEKKASDVTLKEIVGDTLNILNPFKGKKVNPREEQIRRDVRRSLGGLSPEQQDAEVKRRMDQR